MEESKEKWVQVLVTTNDTDWEPRTFILPNQETFYRKVLGWFRRQMVKTEPASRKMTWSNLVLHRIAPSYCLVVLMAGPNKRRELGRNSFVTQSFRYLGSFSGPALLFRADRSGEPLSVEGSSQKFVQSIAETDFLMRQKWESMKKFW